MTENVLIVGATTEGGIGEAIHTALKFDSPDYKMFTPTPLSLDVRSEDSIEDYLQANGPFEYIVYSAGVNNPVWTENVTLQGLQNDFMVNAFGFAVLLGIHAKLFRKEALISAVAITSDAARNPMRSSLSYCGSKAALEQIIRVIAREWVGHTRVNGVAPASVEGTEMAEAIDTKVAAMRGWTKAETLAYEAKNLPLGRRITVYEVAEVVITTLFGPAAQTGSIVHIGGK
jgi:NAD(P)-dependent dehydrogenase (short-subunit alcohol dehydrogenase family)